MISSATTSLLIGFDYNALANYFASGASLDRSLHAEVLRNGVLKDIIQRAEAAVIPPWQLRQPETDPGDATRFFTGKPIIDLKDPQVDQAGASDNFKKLFALFKGLSRTRDLVQFATSNIGLREALNRQLQSQLADIRAFADDSRFEGINLVSDLRKDVAASSVEVPAIDPTDSIFGLAISDAFIGGVASTVRADPIPGLSTTDSFTIDVTTSFGTTSVTIDLADVSGSLDIDNVVDHINSELVAAGGIASTFQVEQVNESEFRIKINLGSGETLSFSTASTTEAAVYVAGSFGTGETSGGFLTKLDDLTAADPNTVFREDVNSDQADTANGVAVDSQGNVYVVGSTAGDLAGQGEVGLQDVYLNKYDGSGNLLYTVRLGAAESAAGFGVAVDGSDNVVVVGQTFSPLTETAYGGNYDTFVTKFDSEGEELFTRQAAPFASDSGLAVTFDDNDDIFISGVTTDAIATDQTHVGGNDAFVTKLDSDGTLVYNKQFGSAGDDTATAIAVDNAGNVFVTGTVDGELVVRKYLDSSVDDPPIWEVDLGTAGSDDQATGIAIDASGDIYVTGYTTNASLSGTIVQAHSGGTDAFVTKIIDSGASAAVDFTSYVGTADSDRAFGIAVNGSDIYITGETEGSIDGETLNDEVDAFVAKLDDTGALQYAYQFGGAFTHRGTGIAVDADGSSVLTRLGLPNGDVPIPTAGTVAMETAARVGQSFFLKIDNGAPQRITIEDTDTMAVLAARISNLLGINGDAKMANEGDLAHLEIKALDGAVIELLPGAEGFDALRALGLTPQRLIGGESNSDEQEAADDATFELGLIDSLNVLAKADAADAVILIENAMREVRKAFRFLTEGPPPDNPLADLIGPPSAYMAARIAAFEFALVRMQSLAAPSTLGLFA